MRGTGDAIGWKLDRAQRGDLLNRFAPRYASPVADHVTLAVGAARRPLPGPVEAAIVGRSDDGQGVEAMVVAIDGTTDRPDGSTFHITWSLGKGRQAKESNAVIRDCGWSPLDQPVEVRVEPARF
jgi:hypothetical protein